MSRSESSPSEENQVEEGVMGASVMTEVLIKTAVQIRDRMNEHDGPRKEVPASARDTWRHAAWMGRIQAGPGASGTFSSARLSMATLTESELISPLRLGTVYLSSHSLTPCLSSSVP